MNEPVRRDVQREKAAEANRLFRMAYALQLDGKLDRAVVLYEKSVRLCPTAEAHTYLGWAMSTRGQFEEAMDHCRKAIALNPDYANPWNDLGAYLLELGRPEESLFFLKRATRMRRHPSLCFPHFNLHRAYLALGDRSRAVAHLHSALEADPDFQPASDALTKLLLSSRTGIPPASEPARSAGTPVLSFPPLS